ncbi:hypothetical protein EYF80_061036 [Liparis tanakae]|uniref:Uncharacterized protein n=1 Tax=Liparis tanakae TaxID=230148 RepID=A0A4Z2EK52_9TELE|nr:hypothetical protein EYF80_061036 [Liparis tanakae]
MYGTVHVCDELTFAAEAEFRQTATRSIKNIIIIFIICLCVSRCCIYTVHVPLIYNPEDKRTIYQPCF